MTTRATLYPAADDGIARLALSSEDALNILGQQTLVELNERIEEVAASALTGGCTGVILTGEGGRAFAAGADIRAMATMSRDEAHRYAARGHQVTSALEALPIPVIAAVDGVALGGGLELAMAADIILATESSSFGQPEVRLGLIPGFGGTARLPRFIGMPRARQMILSARRIDAPTACEWGLVAQAYPDRAGLDTAAREYVAQIVANGPGALAAAKALLSDAPGRTNAEALANEQDAFAARFDSAEAHEGIAAFLEKRAPRFRAEN